MTAAGSLRLIRALHTAVWVFFVACIAGIFAFASRASHRIAFALVALVLVEVVVLLANGRRCPLTALAARHTDERAANFDIYLPLWLARHNQAIFGTLYVAAVVYAVATWLA